MKSTEIFRQYEWDHFVKTKVNFQLMEAIKYANNEVKYEEMPYLGATVYGPVWDEVGKIYAEFPGVLKEKLETRANAINVEYADTKAPVQITTVMFNRIVKEVLEFIK